MTSTLTSILNNISTTIAAVAFAVATVVARAVAAVAAAVATVAAAVVIAHHFFSQVPDHAITIAIWSAVATTKTPQCPLRSEKRKTKILCPFKSLRLFRPCRDAMRPGRIKSLRRHPKSIKRGWEGEYKVENTGTPGDKQERPETNKLMGKRIALVNGWENGKPGDKQQKVHQCRRQTHTHTDHPFGSLRGRPPTGFFKAPRIRSYCTRITELAA